MIMLSRDQLFFKYLYQFVYALKSFMLFSFFIVHFFLHILFTFIFYLRVKDFLYFLFKRVKNFLYFLFNLRVIKMTLRIKLIGMYKVIGILHITKIVSLPLYNIYRYFHMIVIMDRLRH